MGKSPKNPNWVLCYGMGAAATLVELQSAISDLWREEMDAPGLLSIRIRNARKLANKLSRELARMDSHVKSLDEQIEWWTSLKGD